MKKGVRINKYLADTGVATRREADAMIERGRVSVNGKRANLGMLIQTDDVVSVSGMSDKKYVYYVLYKPAGVVTVGAQGGEKEISDVVTFPERVFPIGRLDKDSEGLIIMTNDGRLSKRFLDPESGVEKEYRVEVDHAITHAFLVRLAHGVSIGAKTKKNKRQKTKQAKVRRVDAHTFDIVLTEGKNRQIRRMCSALGYTVVSLKRFRVHTTELGTLKPKQFKKVSLEKLSI